MTLGIRTVCSSASAGAESSITMVTNNSLTDDFTISVSANLLEPWVSGFRRNRRVRTEYHQYQCFQLLFKNNQLLALSHQNHSMERVPTSTTVADFYAVSSAHDCFLNLSRLSNPVDVDAGFKICRNRRLTS